jgi:hypothetical protein
MIRALLLALGAGAVVAACGSSEAGESSCAPIYEWGGATWVIRQVEVTPVAGAVVGGIGVPPCEDVEGEHQGGDGERLVLAEIPGVPRDVALAVPTHPDGVLVREGAELPPDVERLFEPVRCDPSNPPQRLSGVWRGIGGAADFEEPMPPFDVGLRVREAVPERYRGAAVNVRIPDGGDAAAIQAAWPSFVLGNAWTIELEATCTDAGAYVATRVSGVERAPTSVDP